MKSLSVERGVLKVNQEKIKPLLEIMTKRIKEATKDDHIIHGFMIYRCKNCGAYYIMNLEKGLEDPTDDQKTGNHKPVPFVISCIACGGNAEHVFWNVTQHTYGKNYRNYKQYVNGAGIVFQNFFWNDPESNCGVSVLFEPDFFGFGCLAKFVVSFCAPRLDPPEISFVDLPEKNDPLENSGLNREQRRHPKGNEHYKRPKKNKKLYEY